MKKLLDLDTGSWFELETQEDADHETEIGQHAVRNYFRMDREENLPARYFSFRIPADEGTSVGVTMRILETKGEYEILTTGFRNADPFTDYAPDIGALSEHLGIAIDETTYPYKRRTTEEPPRP